MTHVEFANDVVHLHWRNILSTLWTNSSSINNQKQYIGSSLILKIGHNTTQPCAHVRKNSHYIDNKKVVCKAKWETIHKASILSKLLTKSLLISPITPTLQHNVNSSWHALIKRHANLFTEIGIHWTHTLPQFLDTSWRCREFVYMPFKKCPKVFNGIQNRRLCRPLKEMKWLWCQPFLHNLARVLGIIIILKDQPT
jgi:hypothetical protein